MLAINEGLGFRPFKTFTVWQVPVERVKAALAGHTPPSTPRL
jgi:hypothetical protein